MLSPILHFLDPRKPGGLDVRHYATILVVTLILGIGVGVSGTLTLQGYAGHGGFRLGTRPPVLRVLGGGPLPASYSLARYIVRVHDQGGSNSCTGQVGSEMVEIASRERGVPRTMSAGFLYNEAANGTDGGASFSAVGRILQTQGDAPLASFPFDGQGDVWTQPGPSARAAAWPYRYASYRSISQTDRYTIETELRAGRPIMIGLTVHDTLYNLYNSYYLPTLPYDAGGAHFDHSLLVVSYDQIGVTVLNSWGTRWGWHGLARLTWAMLASANLDNGRAALIVATPGKQFPHAAAPFPVKAWESYARRHHTHAIPYRSHGTIGRVPRLWWKTNLHRTIGAPVAREQWHPKYRYMSQRFTRASVLSWPTKKGDPIKVVLDRRLGGGILLGGGVDPYATRCATYGTGCARMVLDLMNSERARYGYPPLLLDWTLSHQTLTCIGATGHARHMAAIGTITHDQFPADICEQYGSASENVGVAAGQSKQQDILTIHQGMASEPYAPGCSGSHHCAWMSPDFTRVGIGFAHGTFSGLSAHYASEEFIGGGTLGGGHAIPSHSGPVPPWTGPIRPLMPPPPHTSKLGGSATAAWYVQGIWALDHRINLASLFNAAGDRYRISPVGLAATFGSECALYTDSPRCDRYGYWPDVSFGGCQVTVQTAGGFGVGDSSGNSTQYVRLYEDNAAQCIELEARIMANYSAYRGGLQYPLLNIAWNCGPATTSLPVPYGQCASNYYGDFLGWWNWSQSHVWYPPLIQSKPKPPPKPFAWKSWCSYRLSHHQRCPGVWVHHHLTWPAAIYYAHPHLGGFVRSAWFRRGRYNLYTYQHGRSYAWPRYHRYKIVWRKR